MNSIKKNRIKNNMRYMWPVYLVSAIVIAIILNVIFGIVHKLPAYKTLTIFVSGEVTDSNSLYLNYDGEEAEVFNQEKNPVFIFK